MLSELKRLNGGIDIAFDAISFSHPPLAPDFKTWYAESESKNLVLQYVRRQVEIKEKEVSLNVKASTLQKSVTSYRNLLKNHDNVQLLKTALDNYDISFLDYLIEMQVYFQSIENLLILERDLELAIAQLSAVEL